MLKDLTNKQRRLADFMSSVSERCYHAGWMKNLEYVLWDAISTGARKPGQQEVSPQDIDQLKRLSADCDGWIYYDDMEEEIAVEIDRWRAMFEAAIAENPRILAR